MSIQDGVKRMIDRLARERVNVHGFILSVDGVIRAEAYCSPFREGQMHRMYSVSKTMTGIAVGMLADEGKISLEDRICDYFTDYLPPQPDVRLLRLTLRDMLRMATCYRWTTYREGVDNNWARTFFTGTPTHEPGTVFNYDTGCSQVLAALVQRCSGQDVLSFLEERLFVPLGATDPKLWLRDPSGCCQGGTGLCMSLRDLHKTAQCLLEGGAGLVPAWYVQEMGKKHIDTCLQGNEEEQYGYGWQCWRTRDGYAMYGLGGQLAVLCPRKRTVFCTIADTRLDPFGVQRLYNAFYETVFPAIGAGDGGVERYVLAPPLINNAPERALETSAEYVFAQDNPLQLQTLRLEKNCLVYQNARGGVRLPFIPGGQVETAYPGWPQVPAIVWAGWTPEGMLHLQCHAVGQAPCGFDMLICFRPDTVTVQCRKSFDPVTVGYDGVASGEVRKSEE